MKIDEKAIIERIRLLRKSYGGKRGRCKFARALGIRPSTYTYYEYDRLPPVKVLLKMCEITGTDLNWLLTGQSVGEKDDFEQKSPEITEIRTESSQFSAGNNLFLRKLEALLTENPALAEPMQAFIDLLYEKEGIEKGLQPQVKTPAGGKKSPSVGGEPEIIRRERSSPGQKRPGWVPLLGRTAAGMVHFWDQTSLPDSDKVITELDELVSKYIGSTIIRTEQAKVDVDLKIHKLLDAVKKRDVNLIQVSGQPQEEIAEFVECEEISRLFPDCFALRIDGDSMSPRINDGDIVILSPSVPAAQGQIAVVRVSNQIGVTCKLIRMTPSAVHLIPINERYETKVVPVGELCGRLRCCVTSGYKDDQPAAGQRFI